VVPVGIAQKAAQAALENSDEDCLEFTWELQARRDLLIEELAGLPVGVPAGGWFLCFELRTGEKHRRH
jgi:N-succinyldiaminopimelate aminotransferase